MSEQHLIKRYRCENCNTILYMDIDTDPELITCCKTPMPHILSAEGDNAEIIISKEEEQEKSEQRKLKHVFLRLIKEEKKSKATEYIVRHILDKYKIYTTKDDMKSEVWIYKDGVYVSQGRSEIKAIMRKILEEYYSQYYYGQVIAKIEADTFIEPEEFFGQNSRNEIPVKNGILNILSRELKPFTPNKIFFNKIPVEYDPNATCAAIDSFLKEVLASEEDKQVFYELAGFALLKEYKFEKAFMLVGDGRNGKGKSLELLKRLVGPENCCAVPLASIKTESFSIAELFGKLLNLAGDIGYTDLKDTGMLKSLTGRDIVNARRKFLKELPFENYAKFVFACNELPTVYDTSRGFWDRWILIEYPYTFLEKKEYDLVADKAKARVKIRDDSIIDKIATADELSGLLNKALDGLKRLAANSEFSVTRGTKDIKDLWIRKANSFIAFCLDFLEEDYDAYISKKEMRKIYSAYCRSHGVNMKSDIVIKKVLQESFGVNDEKIMIGDYPNNVQVQVWQGLRWSQKVRVDRDFRPIANVTTYPIAQKSMATLDIDTKGSFNIN